MKSPDASANDLMGVALEVNLKVGEGARLIRNFDKQKQKLWLWLTLQKSVVGWLGGEGLRKTPTQNHNNGARTARGHC